MMLTNLTSVLRAAGVPVIEVNGWAGRGHGAMTSVASVVLHHTAGAATGNYPSLNVVTNGRSDLPGPLCNLGLGRDGTWYVVAAGLAYHAGAVFDATYSNGRAIGIEMENTGTGQPWPEAQLASMARGVAALCKAYGIPVDRVKGHKEICSPAGRKIDPAGIPGDVAAARQMVAAVLNENPQEDDLTPDQANRLIWCETALRTLVNQATGDPQGDPSFGADMKWHDGNFPGFVSRVDGKTSLSPVDFIRYIDAATNATRKNVDTVNSKVDALSAKLDAIAAAIATPEEKA